MSEFFEHLLHEFELPLSNPVLIFSLVLSIILLSPIVLKKINIPGIIGLIISGVIIGPYGLNLLEKNSAIDLFSTIGLLYIMFIAGLELDLAQFKANKNKSLLFGLFTFVIPLAIGYPVCHYLLGYDFNASFLTASMFATHTLVAYPIVSKLRVAKNEAVAVTVGGTILTDTAVLIILAIIMGNSQGSLDNAFWIRLGVSLAVFSAIMFMVIPSIAKWFFRNLESEKHSHYIFVLSVVFLAAFLAELAGVEPIIGAFVAGLALNPLIPHSSALMNRIEFIGNSLFIPFFLITVGMLVDIKVILSGPMALIIAGTLSLVAIAGKWLAAFFTQLVFRYSASQRQLIFGLSGAHAAATLAVILVGYKADILDENILNGTVILILVTCIVASFATETAAKKIAISSESDEDFAERNGRSNREHILLPVANMQNMNNLLEFATLIRQKKSTDAISVLSVVPNDEEAEINILKAREKLEEFVKQASAAEVKLNAIATIDYNASSGIARTSRETMADLIITGWPQRAGFWDKLLGEKVETLLTKTGTAVFICHLVKPLVTTRRIVVVCPPLSEREKGFELWAAKIATLGQELSKPLIIYGHNETHEALKKVAKAKKFSVTFQYQLFEDWEDFFVISRNISDNDFFVLVSARSGALSHMGILENLPGKLEKHFADHNKLVIYPQQDLVHQPESYEDFSTDPLNKGIKTVQKLGKGIGYIFKKPTE